MAVVKKVEAVKHIIRMLGAATVPEAGVESFTDFEEYLKKEYFSKGWEVEKAEVLAVDKNNTLPVNMLYVLIKNV